jgi:outer membrane protein assembly factor BamA
MFTRYNEFFFGIGNNIDLHNRDNIEFNLFQTTQRFTRVLAKKIFAGIQYQYYQTYNIGTPENSILKAYAAKGIAVGANGSQTSGVGPVFLYDTRDNVIYTRTGSYLDISALFVRDIFGSNHEFTNVTMDARKFFKFYKNDVICFQGLFNYNVGDVPFKQLALMGSDILMRGYYMGSYRDKIMLCGQVEARIPVWRFIGIVLFAAAGQVQPDIHSLNWDDVKVTYGFGLRFMFIKHERVNIGGDLGFGKNTNALYFGSGESF